MDIIAIEFPHPPLFTGHDYIVVDGRAVPREPFDDLPSLPLALPELRDGERVLVEEAYLLLKNPMLCASHLGTPVQSIAPVPGNGYLLGFLSGYGQPRVVFADDIVQLRVTYNGRLESGEMRLQQAFARTRLRVLNERNRHAG